MTKVRVANNQSVWDLAIQYYGAPEGVLQLMIDNPGVINFFDSIPVGTLIVVGEPINKAVVDYLVSKAITPATAIDVSLWILNTGFWNDSGVWVDNNFWND